MDPSKPNDPTVDQGQPIPRPRPAENEVLEGEVIDRGVPLGRPGPPPTPSPTPKKPARTRRTVLWTLLGIAALVFLSGLGIGIIYYDKATSPDTRTPSGTLEQYLQARFDGSTPERLRMLTCGSPNLDELDDLVGSLATKEAASGYKIDVTASTLYFRQMSDTKVEIDTDLVMTAGPQNSSDYAKEHWQFDLLLEDGWRVCGAHRLQ